LGQLALVHAALTLVPLVVAIALGDHGLGLRLAVTIVVLIALGLAALRASPTAHLQTNEGLAVAALAFVLSPLFMTWPMMADGLPVLDAFFESVSALTTTGLTMLDRVAERSPAFLFVRAWLQWIGGLGFAALAVALLLGPHADARRLTGTDTPESTSTTAPRPDGQPPCSRTRRCSPFSPRWPSGRFCCRSSCTGVTTCHGQRRCTIAPCSRPLLRPRQASAPYR
jgi:trk system potassium uptake protein TrkH